MNSAPPLSAPKCTVPTPPSAPTRLHTILASRDDCARTVLCGWVQCRYFQQTRPIAKCDAAAEDGRIVGLMLHDLVSSKPKDLPRAIRDFVRRTAMLRECGLAHIGAMLVRLLSTDDQGTPDEDAAIIALEPSAVTEKQATAIGSAIATCIPHPEPAKALQRVVKSHAALRAMQIGLRLVCTDAGGPHG
jgi:hypothetical protein